MAAIAVRAVKAGDLTAATTNIQTATRTRAALPPSEARTKAVAELVIALPDNRDFGWNPTAVPSDHPLLVGALTSPCWLATIPVIRRYALGNLQEFTDLVLLERM